MTKFSQTKLTKHFFLTKTHTKITVKRGIPIRDFVSLIILTD